MGAKKAVRTAAAVAAAFTQLEIPKLAKGELYVGGIIGPDGKGQHVILLPGDKSGTWDEMMKWAKDQGGDLPTRIEQALLFAHHKAEFQRDYYWSNTPHADDAGCAWGQTFTWGLQGNWHKSSKLRARAVRRLPI